MAHMPSSSMTGTHKNDNDGTNEKEEWRSQQLFFQKPNSMMGYRVNQLVNACPPLDTNSVYCNIIQCDHFADTSVAVTQKDELVGFISGHIKPSQTTTLFIWQVAVSEKARGQNLGVRMMREILARPSCTKVNYLETTVTPENYASTAMFKKLCEELHAGELAINQSYTRDTHFNGEHETEKLFRIGPFLQPKSIETKKVD